MHFMSVPINSMLSQYSFMSFISAHFLSIRQSSLFSEWKLEVFFIGACMGSSIPASQSL